MRKSTVQSTMFTLAALAFMLSLLLGSSSALADCPQIGGRTWHLSQNFWDNQLTLSQSGTTISGSLDDGTTISGSVTCPAACGPTTIQFLRSHPSGAFVQDFTGTIEQRAGTVGCFPILMHGTFRHNGSGLYGWYAPPKTEP
jgi:hypothetical protein